MIMVQICFLVVLVLFNLTSSSSQENITDSERFSKANATACEEGRYVLNKCEERCECRDGKLMNCYRVRKEFTKMDINSRRRFLRTYKMASNHALFRRSFEKVVAYHTNTSHQLLHQTPFIFLPWHRWWLVTFENLLRRIDCRVTIPYWDWSQVACHWWRESGDEDIWNPGDHGLGGDGKPFANFCVETGPFSKDRWQLLRSVGGGCLKRVFSYECLTGSTHHVKRTLAQPVEEFFKFEETIRYVYHYEIHEFVGGTMLESTTSANAPEVVLHHSFLDKLWLQWQKKGKDYKYVYFSKSRRKLPQSEYYAWQWLDSNNLPDQVKVLYEDW